MLARTPAVSTHWRSIISVYHRKQPPSLKTKSGRHSVLGIAWLKRPTARLEMMDFAFTMMDFVFKTIDFASKMMDFAFKMMNPHPGHAHQPSLAPLECTVRERCACKSSSLNESSSVFAELCVFGYFNDPEVCLEH